MSKSKEAISAKRWELFETSYREAYIARYGKSDIAERAVQGLLTRFERDPRKLPTLTKNVAPAAIAAIRAAGFKGRLTRKAVTAWLAGELGA